MAGEGGAAAHGDGPAAVPGGGHAAAAAGEEAAPGEPGEPAGGAGDAPPPPPPAPDPAAGPLCAECGRGFTSLRGLRSHQARRHGRRLEARWYVDGPTCRACLLRFAARPLTLVHVRGSARCMATLRARLAPLPQETVDELDREDRLLAAARRRAGRSVLWAATPAFRVAGPALVPEEPEEPEEPAEALADDLPAGAVGEGGAPAAGAAGGAAAPPAGANAEPAARAGAEGVGVPLPAGAGFQGSGHGYRGQPGRLPLTANRAIASGDRPARERERAARKAVALARLRRSDPFVDQVMADIEGEDAGAGAEVAN